MNLNHWAAQLDGKKQAFNVTVGLGPPRVAALLKYLSAESPVIVGLSNPEGSVGHAVVITAVIYETTDEGPIIDGIIVRDPDPAFGSDQGKRKLDYEQFQRIGEYYVMTDLN